MPCKRKLHVDGYLYFFYFCKYSILPIGASQEQHKEKNGSIFL